MSTTSNGFYIRQSTIYSEKLKLAKHE